MKEGMIAERRPHTEVVWRDTDGPPDVYSHFSDHSVYSAKGKYFVCVKHASPMPERHVTFTNEIYIQKGKMA